MTLFNRRRYATLDEEGQVPVEQLGNAGEGAHPNLAAHASLGLAPEHAHPYAETDHGHAIADTTNLQASLDGKSSTSHHHDGSYAPTHSHPYEASGAVAAHVGAGDPHPGYLTAAEGAAAFEAIGAVVTHAAAGNPHPTYATDADLTAHAAGPHGGGGSTAYAPGSFTVATGNYALMTRRLALTTTQRTTLQGTARLRIT